MYAASVVFSSSNSRYPRPRKRCGRALSAACRRLSASLSRKNASTGISTIQGRYERMPMPATTDSRTRVTARSPASSSDSSMRRRSSGGSFNRS